MKKIFLTLTLAVGIMTSAQVRIGGTGTSVDANAILELQSSTKGLLFPKVALTGTANVAPLSAHVAGMTVYNTATAGDVTPGLYANSGTAWVKLASSTSTYQNIKGNVVTVTSGAYTVTASDYSIYTNISTSGVTITFPDLTLDDAGRTVVVFNNNSSGGNNTLVGNILGIQTNTPLRGMEIMWVGSTWVIIGK